MIAKLDADFHDWYIGPYNHADLNSAECMRGSLFVLRKPALLVLIGVTLFGCLGGLVAALVRPPYFQADAIVIVYEMPSDLRELIGPDEAQQIADIYKAGALQPKVMQRVLAQFPDMTAAGVRDSVQVIPIAYSPLTRITVSASTPERAAALANTIAVFWTSLVDNANSTAWQNAVDVLQAHEDDLYNHIAATQQAIAAAEAAGAGTGSLQAQLATELQELTKTDERLVLLDQDRLLMVGNAFMTTPADASLAVREPDALKLTAQGGVGGLTLGVVFVLWMFYRQRKKLPQDGEHASDPHVLAYAGASSGDGYDER